MKLGVLYSGGKDSNFALLEASKENEISCLITIISENPHSFMFHTPTIELVDVQAELMGIPLVKIRTSGEKEKELLDLKTAISTAVKKYGIEGVVSGAVKSTYQASRIQKICDELGLWSFNPLWLRDEFALLKEEMEKMEIIVSGVAAYPIPENWLGKKINVEKLRSLKINPAGEGGEFETLVIDSPLFKRKIIIDEFRKEYNNYSGRIIVEKFHTVSK